MRRDAVCDFCLDLSISIISSIACVITKKHWNNEHL